MGKNNQEFRAGYVTILGRPNAGKSTLLNSLLNTKLSAISPRPQTTRRRVLGIYNDDRMQIVFLDTPGLLKPRYELQEKMMQYVHAALQDADVLLFIVDVTEKQHPVELNIDKSAFENKPLLLALNKIDLINKGDLLPLIDRYKDFLPFKAIVPISALEQDGLDELKEELQKLLPVSPPYYPQDILSDQPERFFVAEIIRERIFHLFHEEIPYSTEVVVEEFKERPTGKDYIYAVIYVERDSQKGILIGKKGEALKKIGAQARREIEEFLGRDVFLELHVKVNENWRRNPAKLKRLGY
ncbi:MAG TPA: GTPase Era [Caldithrix abyssi]|uniref:GTPase Era n=1 Tax=Caldithrix abyssi TaxID=187145 RepID=A0A7V5UFV4_CALAY|nr:GTPase Era [Caldithrix abyssi]